MDSLRWLVGQPGFDNCNKVAIVGDSKLAVDFMCCTARPSKPLLLKLVEEVRELLHEWQPCKVVFVHVTHNHNS